MQVGKRSTAPVVVEHVLQIKSSQLFKLVLMPEHRLCTQFRQLRQRIEFSPRPFIHAQHGSLTDTIFDFKTSCLEHKTLFFPMLTLSPFSFSPSFQFSNLTFSSPSDLSKMTKLLVYSSSHGEHF